MTLQNYFLFCWFEQFRENAVVEVAGGLRRANSRITARKCMIQCVPCPWSYSFIHLVDEENVRFLKNTFRHWCRWNRISWSRTIYRKRVSNIVDFPTFRGLRGRTGAATALVPTAHGCRATDSSLLTTSPAQVLTAQSAEPRRRSRVQGMVPVPGASRSAVTLRAPLSRCNQLRSQGRAGWSAYQPDASLSAALSPCASVRSLPCACDSCLSAAFIVGFVLLTTWTLLTHFALLSPFFCRFLF